MRGVRAARNPHLPRNVSSRAEQGYGEPGAGRYPRVTPSDREPTLYEWAGGFTALTRMTRIFYEKYVPEDALLAPLFANMRPDHPERVASWLGEVFGGPDVY